MPRVLVAVLAVVLAASGCGTDAEPIDHRLFGTSEPISDVIGTDIRSSQIIGMQCIPGRADPVLVTVRVTIDDWLVDDGRFAVGIRSNDTRFGSHASGCSNPKPLLEQSVFLLGPRDETRLADRSVRNGDARTLIFEIGDLEVPGWAAVLLPTLEFTDGDGQRQTTIFGVMGFYHLD